MDYKEYPFGENWEKAKAFVNQLSEAEAVQFFYETFGEKVIGEKGQDEEYFWKGHYALAEASRQKIDGEWDDWDIDFIASHDQDEVSGRIAGNRAIADGGECPECKSQYRSYLKRLICPVCKSKGYGT